MKTRISELLGYVPALWVAVTPPAVAQPEAEVGIQTYAGLTISGEVGTVYSIEYATNIANPSDADWRCLEFLQLPVSPYLWVDKSGPATGKRFYQAVAMEPPENMVFIRPGTFRMGTPYYDDPLDFLLIYEWPPTTVIISQGFWMGKFEVTQSNWEAVLGSNPSWFNGTRLDKDYGADLSRPVENFDWNSAMLYCSILTDREHAAGRIPSNTAFRLPTSAEWEYACRAGTLTQFSYGDDPDYTKLAEYAWYSDNSDRQTHPVGVKLPNPWGLYDMHGNVWERCQDLFRPGHPGGIAVDPRGPSSGLFTVIRGGGWGHRAFDCRSAYRYTRSPDSLVATYGLFGLRVVLSPVQP